MVRVVAKAPLTIGEMVEGGNGFGGVVAPFLQGKWLGRDTLFIGGKLTEAQ